MKKFVAITAIILGVFAFVSMEASATAPTVGDIPDVQLYTFPDDGGVGIFNLNDFVEDYDDAPTWTGTRSGFTSDPGLTIGSAPDYTVDLGSGGTAGDNGSVLWEATDGDTQSDSDSSEVWRTDFWLTKPSLTDDDLVTTSVDILVINVLRDSALTSGDSLWSGIQPSLSNPETLSWTVSLRGLTDPTSYPKVSGAGSVTGYGLTASIDQGSGVFTLTPQAGGLSDALEVGFLATDGTSKSGIRAIAVQDMVPPVSDGSSGDFAIEHGFETTYTEIPYNVSDLYNAVSDFGWSRLQSTAVGMSTEAPNSIIDLTDAGFTGPSPATSAQASGKVLKVTVSQNTGTQFVTNRIAYETGATYCYEFYLATDATASANTPRLRMGLTNFGGAGAFTEIHESDFAEDSTNGGSALPLAADGWIKYQIYAEAQIESANAPDGIFGIIQLLKTTSGSSSVYFDNVAIYKVKNPIDMAYGATVVPVADDAYDAVDDFDGTFERTTSKASNTDELAIVGLINISASAASPNAYNSAVDTIEIAADGGSITNHTFADGASRSLAYTTATDVGASEICVLSTISFNSWDLADSGNAGPGIYQLSTWVSTSATDRGTSTKDVPWLLWGILEDAGTNADGKSIVFTKQRYGVATPLAGDGWQNYTITFPTNRDLQKIFPVIDTIRSGGFGGDPTGSGDTVYFDDMELRKVKDKTQYFDASLF